MPKHLASLLTLVVPLALLVAPITLGAGPRGLTAPPIGRLLAVTIDDLPVNSIHRDLETWQSITTDLLAALEKHRIPAIGFVNEGKLYRDGTLDPARRDLLQAWVEAGLDLGNHGYSHLDLNRTPLEEYEADLLRGEAVTRPLMAEAGRELRYFRHPFLHAGPDLETKQALLQFLAEHAYREAPVTIDNSEWIFARAYENAHASDEHALAKRIAEAYVPYMESMFAHLERQSRDMFGRDIAHVLLIHANRLNADHFDTVAQRLVERGYRFASLDEVLEDPAYDSPDRWEGRGGITWLHRWALTAGKSRDFFADEPTTPTFVLETAGIDSE